MLFRSRAGDHRDLHYSLHSFPTRRSSDLKKLKLDELVSKRIKLEDVNTAFADMEQGAVARSVIVF